MEAGRVRLSLVASVATLLLPAAGFVVLLYAPELDVRWEHHPSHFWLVLSAGATTGVLAWATGDAARRRGDVTLHCVSLGFLAAAGFLGLHALATPGVLLDGPNLGFQIAAPIGLAVASLAAAASAFGPARRVLAGSDARMRGSSRGLIALMAIWGLLTVSGLEPLSRETEIERASAPMIALAVVGAALFVVSAARFAALARRRHALLPLVVATGFALLAEAMLATAFSRSWHASWWEWHLLILLSVALVAWSARREWRDERFASLYDEQTASGTVELSVLFADLAGFTRFSEERDPREVGEMLNAYFERAIPSIVQEHGGEIDNLLGDALMATFTGDRGGDHAWRASRAAMAIRARTRELADRNPTWPRFRIGVNTGEAMRGVVGTAGGRAYTVIGDAINVAARIESEAPVGGIAVGEATAARLEGAELTELGALEVKGREERVVAFVLESV